MLTRQVDEQSASSGAAADVSANVLETASSRDDEGWAVVSLPDGDDNLPVAGLDVDSFNHPSGVSSLSSANGGQTFDGQTILGSLGPGDDDGGEEDDDDDDMLLLDMAIPGGASRAVIERDDDDAADNPLSIPDTVPSNIHSVRSSTRGGAGPSPNAMGTRDRRQKRQYDIVLVAFLALLSFGAAFLASTWRTSALRLEAELEALRGGSSSSADGGETYISKNNNRSRESFTFSSPTASPLFGGNHQHEEEHYAEPFTVADNCYIKATASVSLGTCGSELKDNIQNASATVLDSISSIATQFGSFWKPPRRPGRNHTSSSPNKVFDKLNKFWKAERSRWNKASERFASEFASAASYGARNASSSAQLLANRTAATAQHTADVFSISAIKIADEVGSLMSNIFSSHAGSAIVDTLSHTNQAIDHSIWNLFDHARDAIEEGTSVVRTVSANKGGVDGNVGSNKVQTKGLLQYLNLTTYKLPRFGQVKRHTGTLSTKLREPSKGLLQYVPSMFLNLSTFKLVSHEIPAFGERK